MRHISVHARRQRFLIVHVGGAVHGGGVSQENDSAHGAKEGDAVQNADLSYLCVIGAKTFVRIKNSRKLYAAVWKGKVYGYREENKSYRVWNPTTHRVVESRNVTFIVTSLYLLPPLSKLSPLQELVPPS